MYDMYRYTFQKMLNHKKWSWKFMKIMHKTITIVTR